MNHEKAKKKFIEDIELITPRIGGTYVKMLIDQYDAAMEYAAKEKAIAVIEAKAEVYENCSELCTAFDWAYKAKDLRAQIETIKKEMEKI
jgi:hypothetical protein